jgi:hypothetical protein
MKMKFYWCREGDGGGVIIGGFVWENIYIRDYA